ncbi:IS1634 family transposase [Candidatus Brocadia pituitae]|nr:IS1634 family transposase [Candidatus Brocadia pituitae]
MYIRDAYKKRGDKKYSCLVLVETITTKKGPRQKTILTLGNIDVPREQWALLTEMLRRRLSGQRSMFPDEPEGLQAVTESIVARLRRKGKLRAAREEGSPEDVIRTDVGELKVEEPRMLGPVLVAEEYWKRPGMAEVLKGCEMSKKEIERAKVEVFGRLVEPMSENATVDWVKRTALCDLPGNESVSVRRDALYRVSDRMLEGKEKIEEALREKERRLFRLEEKISLYDLTGSYFKGAAESNSKAKYGYCRDGRGDCKQVVDEEGFVKGHEVYEGDRTDITTMKDTVERLRERMRDKTKEPTIVVDRGMVSEEKLESIRGMGMKYIVAARHSERERRFGEFEGLETKEIEGDVYVLCRSEERGEKDKGIRERFKERIEEALGKLGKNIESGRLKDIGKIEQKIGRIKERYRRVARHYTIETTQSNGVIHLQWRNVTEDEGKYDGTYLLRTNRKDLTEQEIWSLYIMLTRVERAFRDLKSNLGLRPIYHQKEHRVDAHLFISVLAYHLLHAIEHTLKEKGETRS